MAAAADLATGLGGDGHLLGDTIEEEDREAAYVHAQLALQVQAGLTPGARSVFTVSGGELTVTCRGDGIDGPDAQYCVALALALKVAPAIHALATDTDGAAEVAAAQLSPQTLAAAQVRGLDPIAMLERNDAHSSSKGSASRFLPAQASPMSMTSEQFGSKSALDAGQELETFDKRAFKCLAKCFH